MHSVISSVDLAIVLLKCIGSKYPLRVKLRSRSDGSFLFVRGFADADGELLVVSGPDNAGMLTIPVCEVTYVESFFEVKIDKVKSRVFVVA